MAGKNDGAAIIIKRPKKGGHEGHHGGAWKVAYADFVTAMMAFFLLLWLLNATTEVQKQGISDYFSPSTVSKSTGGAGGMLGGRAIASPGAMTVRSAAPSVSLSLEPTSGASAGKADEDSGGATEKVKQAGSMAQHAVEQAAADQEKTAREKEDARFDQVEKALRDAVEKSPELRELQKHLLVDRTPEGLRIQIVDQDGQPMFPSGSAKMFDRTQKLLEQVAATLKDLPNKISISGHTDSLPYRGGPNGYGNWELSGDRAQASRRVLVAAGLDPSRIAAVAGRADRDPLLPDDPTSARNRRISIVLLRQSSEAAMHAATKSVSAPAAAPQLRPDWTGPRVK
jgi:chemotaxis protein MotB